MAPLQPISFYDVISFACLAFALTTAVLVCWGGSGRGKKKKENPSGGSSNPKTHQQPSSSDVKSKNTNTNTNTSNSDEKKLKEKKKKREKHKQDKKKNPKQPGCRKKDSRAEEEKGERKRHRKEEGAPKKEEDKGSIRISLHGAVPVDESSDAHEDMIYMQDVFDEATARDDPLPGEPVERQKRQARRKKTDLTQVTQQATERDSDRVSATQHTGEQQPTVDATNEVTKETFHTLTQDRTRDTTHDHTLDNINVSDRPTTRPKLKKVRQSGNKSQTGLLQRNENSGFKYDPSVTGQSTESTIQMRIIPTNRKKVSACAEKSNESIRHKDMPTARS